MFILNRESTVEKQKFPSLKTTDHLTYLSPMSEAMAQIQGRFLTERYQFLLLIKRFQRKLGSSLSLISHFEMSSQKVSLGQLRGQR